MKTRTVSILPLASLEQELGRLGPAIPYLRRYLERLNGGSILVEEPYVDRHYLDDYANYYAKSHDSPPAHCSRLHFFSMDAQALEKEWGDSFAAEEQAKGSEARLQEHYLGFVVRRPLASAPMGRTVLRTYPRQTGRRITVVRPYTVNLGSLRLSVEGLAYQQQDGGAAVCASTALWSSLQKVAHISGHRTPTPFEVTKAAHSPFPASEGLNEPQMAEALANLGYSADLMSAGNPELFRIKIITYLRSELPVILLLRSASGGHAVAVTGYERPKGDGMVTLPGPAPIKVRMNAQEVRHLYVHDDNLGSHAKYELFEHRELIPRHRRTSFARSAKPQFRTLQMLKRGRGDEAESSFWQAQDMTVVGALVPKPNKLRLPIDKLLGNMVWLAPLIRRVLPGKTLTFSARFVRGVECRRKLFGRELFSQPPFRQHFFEALSLPRHAGLVSVTDNGKPVLDVVIDVSEVQRHPLHPAILGIAAPGVPTPSAPYMDLVKFGGKLGFPVICGEP